MAYFLQNQRVSFLSLRAFAALMHYHDTGQAARALGIQPQRLLYQLRRLEQALHMRLFQAGHPHWLPTLSAVHMLPKVLAMLVIWEEVMDGIERPRAIIERCAPPEQGPVAFWIRQSTM